MLKKMVKTIGTAALSLSAFAALPGAAQAAVGLNGSYYTFSSGPSSAADALSKMAAASGPTATFTATSICYPNCNSSNNYVSDSTSLTSFLGSGATNLSASAANVTSLANHALDLTGYITFSSAGTYSFSTGSDDGSMLYIDGQLVVNNDGLHSYATASGSVSLAAGEHTIRVLQFENGGDTGLAAMINGSAINTNNSAYSLSTLSAVPEPATWGMMILGFGAMGVALRRSRRESTITA